MIQGIKSLAYNKTDKGYSMRMDIAHKRDSWEYKAYG